jgi:hypothetical protein
MSYVDTKGLYHVGLNGVGLILQGAPDRPAYQQAQAPIYGARFAQGDRDYNDLSFWWYLTQTDWSGGIKDTLSWADDAEYYYSTNIDVLSQPGAIKLMTPLTTVRDNSANNRVYDVKPLIYNNNTTVLYLDSDARTLSGGTIVDSAYSGSVAFQLGHKNLLWQFFDGTNGKITNWDGTTSTDHEGYISSIINGSSDHAFCGVVVGEVLYCFGISTTNKIYCVKTSATQPASAADWTLVFESNMGDNAEMCGASVVGGEIVFLLENAPDLNGFSLWTMNIATGIPTKLRDFAGDQLGVYRFGARYVQTYNGVALITMITDNTLGKGEIWSYNGTTLTRIYSTDVKKYNIGLEAVGFLKGGCTLANNKAYWGNLMYDGEAFANTFKTIDDSTTYMCYPVGYDASANLIYYVDPRTTGSKDTSVIYSYDPDAATTYKDGAGGNAFLVLSQHDKIQSIDKLMNSINIGFENLASGQSIEVYYTTSPTPATSIGSWTLLGTASYTVDGASVNTKNLMFPDAIYGKKVWFRINLKSTTSGTPVMTDFTLEYLPIPSANKLWNIRINCADEIKTLSGRLTDKTGREVRAMLEKAWWTKSALDYQDLDYATTAINNGAGLTNSATSVTVDNTEDFPEQGRIKIGEEEMFYTGKTPTTFTGLVRGARDTVAVAHVDNDVVNNAYKVLITDLSKTAPILNEGKQLEYIVSLSLRET